MKNQEVQLVAGAPIIADHHIVIIA